jgi:hypothetical protein
MSTSDQEDEVSSGSRAEPRIGPLQHRARTWDTGTGATEPARTLRGITRKKIRQKINTYKYKDIHYDDDIRILKILRGKNGSTLKCMLFSSNLRQKQLTSNTTNHEYKALSYWWGDGEPEHPVIMYDDVDVRDGLRTMNPFTSSGNFYIRSNLKAALEQFRSENEDVNVWIDALCINQEDVTEKTAQVARMDEIYSNASSVWVWLGAGKPETKETFDFLKHDILDLKVLDDLVKTKQYEKKWKLVVTLMKNRWFSRRWVIQELALAKNAVVRWGSEEMEWSNFADAIALVMTKHDEITEILGNELTFSAMQDPDTHVGDLDPRLLGANTLVNASSNLFRRKPDGAIKQRLIHLEVLVSSLFLAFEASEPRDTIYAVLSLAKDTMIQPELGKSPSWLNESKSSEEESLTTLLSLRALLYIWLYPCYLLFNLVWTAFKHRNPADSSSHHPSSEPIIDPRIAPDYDKSLTDVCADFMEYCVETSQSLDILCRHWAPPPKSPTPLEKLKLEKELRFQDVEKMPTWIPSIKGHAYGGPEDVLMGRRNGDSFVGCHERQNHQHYHASGNFRPAFVFGKCNPTADDHQDLTDLEEPTTSDRSLDVIPEESSVSTKLPPKVPTRPRLKKFDGTLTVKGFELDTIEHISGRVMSGIIPGEAFEFGGWPKVSEMTSDDKYPDEVPDQLWRTLVADRGPDGTNAPAWYRRACLECLTHVDNVGNLNTNKFRNVEDTPATMKLFLKRVRNVVWNRRFFLTAGKRRHGVLYGIAPPKASNNDIICILFGCSVPVVLRKVSDDRYNFIGECYVHGMMDGESLPLKMPEHPYSGVNGFTLI